MPTRPGLNESSESHQSLSGLSDGGGICPGPLAFAPMNIVVIGSTEINRALACGGSSCTLSAASSRSSEFCFLGIVALVCFAVSFCLALFPLIGILGVNFELC